MDRSNLVPPTIQGLLDLLARDMAAERAARARLERRNSSVAKAPDHQG